MQRRSPSRAQPDLSSLNASAYRRFTVVRDYNRRPELQPPERTILARFGEELRGRRILDIGVGCGRTTPGLLALTGDYIGIDVSPEMVSQCRRKFPAVRFEVCDVRDLSRFTDHEFDMVLFSFNGLDYLEHASRLHALDEIGRILAPGGLFVFSSHNRAKRPRAPWDVRAMKLNFTRRPLNAVRLLASLPVAIVNHLRMRRHERVEPDYAMVNDDAHSYSLVTYYVSVESQVAQLLSAGFRAVEAVDLDGRWLERGESMEAPPDAWIYYVCRR